MGCIGKFLFTALAFWGFGTLGWIALVPGVSIWLAAFWTFLIILIIDALLIVFRLLVQAVAIPFTFLTAGIAAWAIEGVFKYAGLYAASKLTAMFTIPLIFGTLWWQALLIGFAFAVISVITTPRSSD